MNDPAHAEPTEVRIRPARESDEKGLLSAVSAAFGEEGERVARLVTALHEADRSRLSLVAEVGGEVVGHVQLNLSWVDAPDRLVEVLVLSPLSVRPHLQRRGIGAALVIAALREADAGSCPAVFLEGDPAYYGRLGFRRASDVGFERPSVRIPDDACQVALLTAYQPWMRGALVYCDPFWALDCVGLRPG